jgi:hypothetical protein
MAHACVRGGSRTPGFSSRATRPCSTVRAGPGCPRPPALPPLPFPARSPLQKVAQHTAQVKTFLGWARWRWKYVFPNGPLRELHLAGGLFPPPAPQSERKGPQGAFLRSAGVFRIDFRIEIVFQSTEYTFPTLPELVRWSKFRKHVFRSTPAG